MSEDQLGALKLKEARGAEITNLDHDGPACKAGMRMHDVILQMNGQVVESEEQLRRMLKDMPVGRSVSFVISRDGQTQTMTMTDGGSQDCGAAGVGAALYRAGSGAFGCCAGEQLFWILGSQRTAAAPEGTSGSAGDRDDLLSSSFTGAKLEVMGPQLAEFFGALDGAGLLVRSVDGNSPAEEAGMKAGDVVVKINSIPVANGTDWTKTVHDNKGKPVPVVVLRDKREQTLTLDAGWKEAVEFVAGVRVGGFFPADEAADPAVAG